MTQPVNLDAAVERLEVRLFVDEPSPVVLVERRDLRTILSALSASNARPSKPCEECKGTGNKHCRPIAAGDLTKYDLCTECEGTGRVSSPRFCARAVAAEKVAAVLALAVEPLANLTDAGRSVNMADPLGKWLTVSNLYNAEDALAEWRTTLASMKGEG